MKNYHDSFITFAPGCYAWESGFIVSLCHAVKVSLGMHYKTFLMLWLLIERRKLNCHYLWLWKTPLVAQSQGDQIRQLFAKLGYFWKLIMVFLKGELAQRIGDFWASFCLSDFITFSPK
jgi:hypothetical protein